MAKVSFRVAVGDRPHIRRIVKRAAALAAEAKAPFDPLDTEMDLCACHANGNPLDFTRMSQADDFNLAHDVFGIERHLDRKTGKLTDHFRPRFSKHA